MRRHLPEALSGWTALDIGCNAGFYSFELARRGARVTGIDYDPHYLKQARWAARHLGLADQVEFREMAVYDLARTEEPWDLVLSWGSSITSAIRCSGWTSWPARSGSS